MMFNQKRKQQQPTTTKTMEKCPSNATINEQMHLSVGARMCSIAWCHAATIWIIPNVITKKWFDNVRASNWCVCVCCPIDDCQLLSVDWYGSWKLNLFGTLPPPSTVLFFPSFLCNCDAVHSKSIRVENAMRKKRSVFIRIRMKNPSKLIVYV